MTSQDYEQRGLNPLEVENESLRNRLTALQQKVLVIEDLQSDVARLRNELSNSEGVRQQ